MKKKPLPEPCYPCEGCGDIQSYPANMLWWSDAANAWYCANCFDADKSDELGDMSLSLAYELNKRGLNR